MAIDELQRLLQEAYVRMDAEALRALRPFGLTPTMLTILAQLECSQGKRLVDLTNATLVDASTLTRLIDRLERAALVQRTSDPDDRRAQRVILTPARLCQRCPLRENCTTNRDGRRISRSFDEAYLERVHGYHQTAAYKKVYQKRKVWVEPLFGEAQQWHGLRRFRLRGLRKVNCEGIVTALGQNLKRLLSVRG